MEPCKNEGIGERGYCVEHGCCLCGGTMLADTEDWKVHLCEECSHGKFDVEGLTASIAWQLLGESLQKLIDAAYEAGRKSVIGGPLESDAEVEKGR